MLSKKTVLLTAASIPAALLLCDAVLSLGNGIFAGGKDVPKQLATGGKACGNCHGPEYPTGAGVNIAVGSRVLDLGATTAVTLSARGSKVKNAGFNAEIVGKGALIAGSNNQINTTAMQATHKDAKSTSWSISFKADSTTPGLTELYAAVNDVNLNGDEKGDAWAFHNGDPTDTFSTPVRLYTNAKGVVSNGLACPDGNGNYAVYGSPTVPTIGSSTFKLEAYGLPPGQILYFMLGINSAHQSVDLAPIGAKGCFLHTDIFISFYSKTSGTDSKNNRRQALGTWIQPFPIPNWPQFKGLTVLSQVAAVDADSKLGLPTVWTNGIKVTFQ